MQNERDLIYQSAWLPLPSRPRRTIPLLSSRHRRRSAPRRSLPLVCQAKGDAPDWHELEEAEDMYEVTGVLLEWAGYRLMMREELDAVLAVQRRAGKPLPRSNAPWYSLSVGEPDMTAFGTSKCLAGLRQEMRLIENFSPHFDSSALNMTDGDDVERVGRCGDERGPHYLGITVASSLPSLFEYYTDEFLRMQPRLWPAVVRGRFPEAGEPMPDPPPETQNVPLIPCLVVYGNLKRVQAWAASAGRLYGQEGEDLYRVCEKGQVLVLARPEFSGERLGRKGRLQQQRFFKLWDAQY
ncbi:unnamed protein product [Vitrella brassicaformis CCMP3155]|uniref:Uncharacterized protein n=1 Tax=Vitrella brassicaformis (strain CCMP3155) TaxID=1169540 RepID=A0A0G4EPD6_VITBC|nr:unnamed protein product [Vitrella brassicaformis CCMP3155]|eukprot:CEL99294.1 unnamed protein product [Vitrella brassicaformis CCMP3155]